MSNRIIVKIFKYSFLPLLIYFTGAFIFNTTEGFFHAIYAGQLSWNILITLSAIPFCWLIIARLYNLLAYGKWSVGE
jgi:hypothetical protein